MNASQRSRLILHKLDEKGELTVHEVCSLFDVSPATARRVFRQLSDEMRAYKTWGGIRSLRADTVEKNLSPTQSRIQQNVEGKQRIARKAASLVEDGGIVFIDGGSTTFHLARYLAERPVRILTNSILIAHEIDCLRHGSEGAEVFLTGGYLYPRSGLLVGPDAVTSIQRHHASQAFLSVGGIHQDGAFNNHALVVEVERMMLANAQSTYLLADTSKFQQREMFRECEWHEITAVITDGPLEVPHSWIPAEKILVADPAAS